MSIWHHVMGFLRSHFLKLSYYDMIVIQIMTTFILLLFCWASSIGVKKFDDLMLIYLTVVKYAQSVWAYSWLLYGYIMYINWLYKIHASIIWHIVMKSAFWGVIETKTQIHFLQIHIRFWYQNVQKTGIFQ